MTMENTGKVLFENDHPQWYVAKGDHWEGPLSASEVYQKVLNREIGWAHFVWKPGQTAWERICDLKEFQAAVPPLPHKSLSMEVKKAAQPVVKRAAPPKPRQRLPEESKIWFLYLNETQFGPFALSEILQVISSGRVKGENYAWKDGMSDWERLDQVAEFEQYFGKSPNKNPPKFRNTEESSREQIEGLRGKDQEQRRHPRRPLVARILMTQGDLLITAMCRDISVGGLQVLTDRIPGQVGSRLKMNVSATEGRGTTTLSRTKIEPFVAEGVIVRILEDGRGFSFRFDQLTESARRAIESYITAF